MGTRFIEFLDWFSRGFSRAFLEGDRWKLYLKGMGITLELTITALVIGVILGVLVAVIRTAHDQQRVGSKNLALGILNALCKVYTTVIRGTPMMVQLLIWGFVIFKTSRNHTMVGILGLGINSGAYVAEIVRGGLMSVDVGQSEASRSLGLGYVDTMRFIVIPQAFKNILPSLGNEFIMMLKETSLASTFFLGDIMTSYLIVKGATFLTLEPLTIVAAIYLCVTYPLSKLVDKFGKKMSNPNSYRNRKVKAGGKV